MELAADECWRRLEAARHGVLATVHQARGVDAVPVVFVVDDRRVVIPVDTVKAKRARRLQRLENLRTDSRCTVLVEQYSDDWSQLWWVRVHGHGEESEAGRELVALLAARYVQYRDADAIASLIVVTADRIAGWASQVPEPR